MKDRKADKRLILPRDEFEEDASEGLGKLNREEAQEDLQELRDRLDRRLRKPWMIWLTSAAAVVIILIASAVYISLFRVNRMPGTRMAFNREVIRDTVLIAMAEPIVRMDTILIAMAEPIIRTEFSAGTSEMMPAPDISMVVISTSMDKKEKEAARPAAGTAARETVAKAAVMPAPQGVMDEFNTWVEKNIKYPADAEPGVRHEVIVIFKVAADSTLYDLKVEKSPGDSFTREAFRLLREGPKWVPVTRDGKVVEEETRISIIFK